MAVSNAGGGRVNYEETAYALNNRLPVAVTAYDLKRNPEFCNLLEALTHLISENGASKSADRDLAENKDMLMKHKRKWLQCHTLYTEIQEIVLDQRLQSSSHPASTSNSQFYQMVGEMLSHAEIGEYLDCNPVPETDVTLLGLSLDKLDRANPHKSHKQSMLQKLIPDVESRLRRRCETLVNFHDSTPSVAADSRLDLAKASQLPAIITVDHQKLIDDKKLLKKNVIERRKLTSHYQRLLKESFELLHRLLVDHRLKSQPENDVIASEWLAARCDAMCLKIKVLELQLLYDTYYTDTVRALSVIRSELDTSINDTESELNRVTTAVRSYESVGIEFDSLVEEFTRVRAEVDNRRWALHELKKHSSDTHIGLGVEDSVNHSFLS